MSLKVSKPGPLSWLKKIMDIWFFLALKLYFYTDLLFDNLFLHDWFAVICVLQTFASPLTFNDRKSTKSAKQQIEPKAYEIFTAFAYYKVGLLFKFENFWPKVTFHKHQISPS